MRSLYHAFTAPHGEFLDYEDFCRHFRLTIPQGFNYAYDVLDVLAQQTPESRALLWAGEGGAFRSWDFGAMKRLTDQAAHALKAQGVGKGDPVLVMLGQDALLMPVMMALLKLGAVACPATCLLNSQDIAYCAKAGEVRGVIALDQGELLDRVDQARVAGLVRLSVGGSREGWVALEKAMALMPDHFERPAGAACGEDPMLLYFTSGTTGLPKPVLHDCRYPLAHLVTAAYWHGDREGGLHLTVCDSGWSKAAWGMLYGPWLMGSAVFMFGQSAPDAGALLRAVSAHGVDSLCAAHGLYRKLLEQDLEALDLSCLKHLSLIGEPIRPEVFFEIKERLGLEVREAYGQTETAVVVGNFLPKMSLYPGSMGKPSPLYHVDIVDGEGLPCPAGVSGEVVVRTHHGLPVGLCLNPLGLREGLYHTGDVAWRDEWGYFWYVGRADDVIRSSGYRIGPYEVEAVLLRHPAVAEVAVTGAPDPLRYQVVKATIVLAPGYEASEALKRELQDHVKQTTAPYKTPRILTFVDKLPRTLHGRLQRNVVREALT